MSTEVTFFDQGCDVSRVIKNHIDSGVDIERGKYRGVTTILSKTKDQSGLIAWRDRVGHDVADRIVKESTVIGNSLDKLLNESFNENFDPDPNEVGYKLYKQLIPFVSQIKPIALQLKVWSDKFQVMGFLDCLGYYEGELSLIDFKNSKQVKDYDFLQDYFLQCTIYCIILKLMFNINVKQIVLMIALRDSQRPQIVTERVKYFVKESVNRINQYHSLPRVNGKVI